MMKKTNRILTTAATVAALSFTVAPAASAAPTPEAPQAPAATAAESCPSASDFSLTAPSHTEAAGNLLDKQITFGSYWTGGNVQSGTQATLTASGPAEVTLLNGETYNAPVVAGGTVSGVFPGGGAAFAPSFRLEDSNRDSANGATNRDHVTSISYPVTVSGNFGSCDYTVEGTANSKFNVTSIELTERA